MEHYIELEYKDIKKKVIYYFPTYSALARFMRLCTGDKDTAGVDFRLTADLAAECSKVNTMAVQYALSMGSAALLRDLFNYGRIAKDYYKISINGVIHTCRPHITLTLKRGK